MKTEVFAREQDFLNLSKKKAQDLAEARNMVFQLVRKDDERYFNYPTDASDVRLDRIYVEIDNGLVTKAKIT